MHKTNTATGASPRHNTPHGAHLKPASVSALETQYWSYHCVTWSQCSTAIEPATQTRRKQPQTAAFSAPASARCLIGDAFVLKKLIELSQSRNAFMLIFIKGSTCFDDLDGYFQSTCCPISCFSSSKAVFEGKKRHVLTCQREQTRREDVLDLFCRFSDNHGNEESFVSSMSIFILKSADMVDLLCRILPVC